MQFPVNLHARIISYFRVGSLYAFRNYAIVRNKDTVQRISNHRYTLQYSDMTTCRTNGVIKFEETNFGLLNSVPHLKIQITYNTVTHDVSMEVPGSKF